eukprot:scaffold245119_cov17-Prasinocladus_malaysianus.AAC.1
MQGPRNRFICIRLDYYMIDDAPFHSFMACRRWHHASPPETLASMEWPYLVAGCCAHSFLTMPIHNPDKMHQAH